MGGTKTDYKSDTCVICDGPTAPGTYRCKVCDKAWRAGYVDGREAMRMIFREKLMEIFRLVEASG